MSNREKCISLIQEFPEERLAFAALWLEKNLHDIEEAEDDAFCIALNDAFLDNPDKGELVDFDEAVRKLGAILP
jgi:hypothetical protein